MYGHTNALFTGVIEGKYSHAIVHRLQSALNVDICAISANVKVTVDLVKG